MVPAEIAWIVVGAHDFDEAQSQITGRNKIYKLIELPVVQALE